MANSIGKNKHSGILISMAWPDTLVVWNSTVYQSLLRLMGGSEHRDNRVKVGHAAAALIDKQTGQIDYFDFGRYITPHGQGRVRSKETDLDIHVPFKAEFDADGALKNMEQILQFFGQEYYTHGQGRLIASACDLVDYDRTMHYVNGLQSRGPIAYGPFAFGGSNCSRFVANALYAGCVSKKVRLKLTYPRSLTPTPLGTVINGDTVGTIWEVNEGEVSNFNGTKWSPVREVIWQFGDTPLFKLTREGEPRNWLEGSLIEPKRPDDLPADATWFGAIGSGAWFRLTQPDGLEQNEFRFQRYSAYGVVDCDRVVVPRIGQLNAHESFTLTYETNCRFCTVVQAGEKVILESVREFTDVITLPVDSEVVALPVRN